MFNGKSYNNEFNILHKRPLRVLLDDYEYTFEELLQKIGEHTVHTKYLQELLFGVFKLLTSSTDFIFWHLFECRPVNCNLRVNDLIQLPNMVTVRYGNNSLKFKGSIL